MICVLIVKRPILIEWQLWHFTLMILLIFVRTKINSRHLRYLISIYREREG